MVFGSKHRKILLLWVIVQWTFRQLKETMQGLEIKVNFLLLIFPRNPFYVCNLKKTLHDRPVKIVAKMFQLGLQSSYWNFYRHATKADFSLQLIEVELSNFEFIEQRNNCFWKYVSQVQSCRMAKERNDDP